MTRSRSATVIPVPPPLVILITASVSDLIALRYSRKTAGSAVGLPSFGSRACRWITAAPAWTAATDWATTSSTVYGRCGDIVGVWPDPVTAHVMMTFRAAAIATSGLRRQGLSQAVSADYEQRPHY